MNPLETAMKLAGASSKCEKYKCPFMAQCKGDYTTCGMKEVALIIRSQAAEIDSLKAMIKAYQEIIASTQVYITDLEKINKRYHDIVLAFYQGYRPKKRPDGKRGPYKTRKKIDPTEMDGDERFACANPSAHEPPPPLVVI